jgi:hypothetical protein
LPSLEDAALHLAARAVDRLIEMLRSNLARLQRSNDEARVGIAAGDFCLAHDAAIAAPTVER